MQSWRVLRRRRHHQDFLRRQEVEEVLRRQVHSSFSRFCEVILDRGGAFSPLMSGWRIPSTMDKLDMFNAPLRAESDFHPEAGDLQIQCAELLISSPTSPQTSLAYVFASNEYQCIMASADRILSEDSLQMLMRRLRGWARRELGLIHVSTPRLIFFLRGCWRKLLRDDVSAAWHYVLGLGAMRGAGEISIDLGRSGDEEDPAIVSSTRLGFNQFIIHSTTQPWGVTPLKARGEPTAGSILLDGYLW
jgi:hypothetical protein